MLLIVAAAISVASALYMLQKRFHRARLFGWAALAVWLASLCTIMFFQLVEAHTFPYVVVGSAVVLAVGLFGLVRSDDLDAIEEVMAKEDP